MFSNSLKSRPTSFCFRRKTVDPKPHILNVINCLQIRHDNLFRPWSSDVSYFACRNNLMTWLVGEIYTSEATGNDETGDGSQEKPFKTILRVSHSIIKLSASMVDKNKIFKLQVPIISSLFFSQAMKHAEQEPFPPIYVDSKKENEVCIHCVRNIAGGAPIKGIFLCFRYIYILHYGQKKISFILNRSMRWPLNLNWRRWLNCLCVISTRRQTLPPGR